MQVNAHKISYKHKLPPGIIYNFMSDTLINSGITIITQYKTQSQSDNRKHCPLNKYAKTATAIKNR